MSQMMNYVSNEDEIELRTLISTLWDFRVFIIQVTVVFGLVSLVFSSVNYFLANPITVYEAQSIVGVDTDQTVPRQKQAYLSILSSQASITAAISNLELSHDFIYQDVIVSEVIDTNQVIVTVKYPNATDVQVITDAIVNQSIMVSNDVLLGVSISSREMASLTGNTTIIEDTPNIMLNIVIGLILGGMVSVFVVFFMEYYMDKVKTVNNIEKGLNVEVLATLPNTQPIKKQGWWPWKIQT